MRCLPGGITFAFSFPQPLGKLQEGSWGAAFGSGAQWQLLGPVPSWDIGKQGLDLLWFVFLWPVR